MTTHDLELVVLGMVLQQPALLKSIATSPGGVLAELSSGRQLKLQDMLGPNVQVATTKTAENVLAEWNRRMKHDNAVRVARQRLHMAQLGIEE